MMREISLLEHAMAARAYILGGFQSDFSQNWAREG